MKQIISLFLCIFGFISFAQDDVKPKLTVEQYIEKYSAMAVEEMYRSHIPASITLAQGILESGNGNSRLATQANNHFGIKCKNTWTGQTLNEDDDDKIRDYLADYNTRLLLPPLTVFTVSLCKFYFCRNIGKPTLFLTVSGVDHV